MKNLSLGLFTVILVFCLAKTTSAQTDQIVDNGALTAIENFPSSGCTYRWTNNNINTGLAASGVGNILPFTAQNNTPDIITSTVTAAPVQAGLIYVPKFNGIVSVINSASNTEIATIPVGAEPWGVSASKDGKRVYVTNSGSNTISVISTASNAVITTINVGAGPHGIVVSPDGSRVYVANTGFSYLSSSGPNSVSVINTSTNKVIATVAVGITPVAIAISPDGSKVYVANYLSNTISVINTATNTVSKTFDGGAYTWGIIVSPDGSRIYVCNPATQTVSVISTADYSVIATIPIDGSAAGIALSADGSRAYVAIPSKTTLAVINTKTNNIITVIGMDSSPSGVSLSVDGSVIYVTDYNSNNVSAISTATNSRINTIDIGAAAFSVGNAVSPGPACNGLPVTFTIKVRPAPLPHGIVTGNVTGSISACEGVASANFQKFLVSAHNLSGNVLVTTPTGFEISLDNNNYKSSIEVAPSGGIIGDIPVYVRSSAAAPAGALAGIITLSSLNVADEEVHVTANIHALPTVSTIANQTILAGQATHAVNFARAGNAVTWTNDKPTIGLPANGTGDIASFVTVNAGSVPVTATITATPIPAGFAYITNSASSSVSVIDVGTNKVVSTIAMGQDPQHVYASPDGNFVYVSDPLSRTVSVINTTSNTVTASIPVGQGAFSLIVSPDNSRLYLVNLNEGLNADNISVINTATNSIISTIPTNAKIGTIAISPDGNLLYTANYELNTVSVFNTVSGRLITDVAVGAYPQAIIVSPDGSNIYVTNSSDNSISVINSKTNTVTAVIPVGNAPYGIAENADGSRVYVTNFTDGTLSIINTFLNKVLNTVDVGANPMGVSVSFDGSEVYIANSNSGTVTVINTLTGLKSAVINVGLNPFSPGSFISRGHECSGLPTQFTITVNPVLPSQITVNGNLATLHTIYGTPSVSTVIQVSGSNLKSAITITPPAGFEVSSDNAIFSKILTIGGRGEIGATKVYFRLAQTTPVGTYTGNIALSGDGANTINLTIDNSSVDFAVLNVIADDKSMQYGGIIPPLTISYQGFVNNEGPSQLTTVPFATTIATISSPVGKYPITAQGAASHNYSFIYIAGILDINQVVKGIMIPNTFSPNGDGINDTWSIKNLETYTNCSVKIYTRYGQQVFKSSGYYKPWDGTNNGAAMPFGTYYYVINLNNGDSLLSGYVTILR
ncbi:gliding motility-associated C-terminal domain-containing protein [Mucilaginibacter dorajii]|uniref:MBG domain-containing protein n=1 Tax=Mucilaginibacter dorajii TaxID=692994 RepID=A0ABP7NYZ9_9SPHI|nr:gliding motility-associated C-terminal domain-containing protein [Mucilaginibacter dorajii]MCS3737952.1 gliding motility-associated-like protein [Mucilaginibacter dorajii]